MGTSIHGVLYIQRDLLTARNIHDNVYKLVLAEVAVSLFLTLDLFFSPSRVLKRVPITADLGYLYLLLFEWVLIFEKSVASVSMGTYICGVLVFDGYLYSREYGNTCMLFTHYIDMVLQLSTAIAIIMFVQLNCFHTLGILYSMIGLYS